MSGINEAAVKPTIELLIHEIETRANKADEHVIAAALRLRELMILRTTALCGAAYEWGVHVAAFGAKAGWRPEELSRTVHGGPGWSEEEALVVRLAESLHRSADVDDELWAALAARFGADQLIELVMLAGLYHAVSFMVNATRVAHEPEAPRFP